MDSASGEWDRLVIVRYRSRRDIAEIFSNPAFAAANKHKWAALAGNNRSVVQALHIPALYFPAILIAILGCWLIMSLRTNTAKNPA